MDKEYEQWLEDFGSKAPTDEELKLLLEESSISDNPKLRHVIQDALLMRMTSRVLLQKLIDLGAYPEEDESNLKPIVNFIECRKEK